MMNNELRANVAEQLQQLMMLMHRGRMHGMGPGRGMMANRGQGRVLALLKMKPEMSQRDLTFLMGMSKQSLAELLTKLERSGYIEREASEEDRRVMNVRLTETGAMAAEDVGESESPAQQTLDCLSDEELGPFSEQLSRIIERWEGLFPQEDFHRRREMMEMFMSEHGEHHHHPHGFGRGRGFGRER